MAMGDAAQAVSAPFTTMAQATSSGLASLNQTVTTTAQTVGPQFASTSNAVSNTARQVSYTDSNLQAAAPAASYSPPELTSTQKDAIKQGKNVQQPDLPILPDETLKALTVDQRGLQNAAQKAALTAPVGETIFWTLDDRTGTVVVKDEHKMGESLCRSFEQSVTIDGTAKEGRGIACRDDDTGRWALAF